MTLNFRLPAVLSVLLFSSVLVMAASPVQSNGSEKEYVTTDLILFGSLGVKFLTPQDH
jgi:hypothetical protein